MWENEDLFEIAEICGKWLNLIKRFKDVGNDVYIWEMAPVFEKRLNYVGNDLDVWEMAQICAEMT